MVVFSADLFDEETPFDGDTDEETLRAIIQVQLEDLDEALANSNRKGKCAPGRVSAADYPLQAYRDYLHAEAIFLADAKLAKSMDRALAADAAIIGDALQLFRDHQLAISLAEGVEAQLAGERVMHSFAPRMERTPGADPRLPMGYATSSGTSSGTSSSESLVREATCCSCIELRYCVTAPCGDTYCHNCLITVFRNATRDEELFPPRCHKKEIPLFLAQPFLQKEDILAFKAKREEYTTHNRVYCHNGRCGVFIPTKNTDEDCAVCGQCAQLTCVSCKQKYHGKTDCPTDENLKKTLELAVNKGWQRCRSCHALVERSFGCQHIRCKCGDEFCYRCGLKWKTCRCGDWDDTALDRRAEQLAIRESGVTTPVRAAALIRTIRGQLQNRHECEHQDKWAKLNGVHNCEMCGDTLRQFIWSCEGCRLLACTQCRMNRI